MLNKTRKLVNSTFPTFIFSDIYCQGCDYQVIILTHHYLHGFMSYKGDLVFPFIWGFSGGY